VTLICSRRPAASADALHTHSAVGPELSMGWVDPWVGLGWVGSHKMDPWTTLSWSRGQSAQSCSGNRRTRPTTALARLVPNSTTRTQPDPTESARPAPTQQTVGARLVEFGLSNYLMSVWWWAHRSQQCYSACVPWMMCCAVESTSSLVGGQLQFSRYLESVVATLGGAATLACHIVAEPSSAPRITWYTHCSSRRRCE